MFRQIVYVSAAVAPTPRADLDALLAQSRSRNATAGVTGLLLFRDGAFMQCLEGPPEAVAATYARIRRDPRHRGVVPLVEATRPQRLFAAWSMGFAELDPSPAIADARALLAITPPAALAMLGHFAAGIR